MGSAVSPFHLALSLTAEQAWLLVQDRRLNERLDQVGLAFVVFGADRIRPDFRRGELTFDPSATLSFLSSRFARTGLLVAGAPHRDHPYNLARRIASIDHISRGWAGLLLGQRDYSVPAVPDDIEAWGGAGLGTGVPLTAATVADAALAIQQLWQSWPVESIIADRETRTFVLSEQIKRVNHRGAFDIAGPLTVPSTLQGTPILAADVSAEVELETLSDRADVILLAAGANEALTSSANRLARERAVAPELRQRVVRELLLDSLERSAVAERLDGLLRADVDGAVLRVSDELLASAGATFQQLITEQLPKWIGHAGAVTASDGDGTLRSLLRVPRQPDLLANAEPAFSAAS